MIFYFRDWDKRQMTIFSRYLTPVSLNLFQDTRTHLFSVSVYLSRPQHWDGVDTSNPSSWNATTDSSHVVNTMAVDGLVTDGARPSAAMMVTYSRGIFQSQHKEASFFSMTTSSDGNISALLALRVGIRRSPENSPHKGQWHGALMFSLICAWTKGWVNNREAGDLRRHRTHYDVSVMGLQLPMCRQGFFAYTLHRHWVRHFTNMALTHWGWLTLKCVTNLVRHWCG